MKIKTYKSLSNKSKKFHLFFSPAWDKKKKNNFSIIIGNTSLKLGSKEARMLHAFLNKVY